jgi:hypothetical protein
MVRVTRNSRRLLPSHQRLEGSAVAGSREFDQTVVRQDR